MLRSVGLVLLLALSSAAVLVRAQGRDYEPPTRALPPDVQQHVDMAYLLLNGAVNRDGLTMFLFSGGLPMLPKGAPSPLQEAAANKKIAAPAKAFDQLYFLGMNTVNAWALDTSDGIILFDALDNTAEAQQIIEAGMKKAGLDPARIKYLVITHGHGDHFGGAKYLQDTFHPRVLASAADWELMKNAPANRMFDGPPARDMEITDGQKLTLGKTTVTLYITAGHTPGTVSAIVPVTDRGVPHVLGFWGGTGMPRTLEPGPNTSGIIAYRDSLLRFAKLGIDAGVDGIISNHDVMDNSFAHTLAMPNRKAEDPNPWIVGQGTFIRYMAALVEAAEAGIAFNRYASPSPRTAR